MRAWNSEENCFFSKVNFFSLIKFIILKIMQTADMHVVFMLLF